MRSLYLIPTVVLAALVGCATSTGVVPIGNGNYQIAGHSATALGNGGSEKLRLMKTANEYCAQQGKTATLVNADSNDGHAGSAAWAHGNAYSPGAGATYNAGAAHPGKFANADVVFRCD
jgi:hypothetical protein